MLKFYFFTKPIFLALSNSVSRGKMQSWVPTLAHKSSFHPPVKQNIKIKLFFPIFLHRTSFSRLLRAPRSAFAGYNERERESWRDGCSCSRRDGSSRSLPHDGGRPLYSGKCTPKLPQVQLWSPLLTTPVQSGDHRDWEGLAAPLVAVALAHLWGRRELRLVSVLCQLL